MATEVRELATDEEWDEAVPILRQLWNHADDAFVREWREEDDYRLFGLYEVDGADAESEATGGGETLVAVAGVSIQRVLHHERHLWVHDFVVDEPRRGEGLGGELLDRLAEWASERDCAHLSLACRAGNDDGRSFYESEGLDAWGQVLEREL
ncbi:GNAT family N-acetyltransferase [Halosimplex pelagicum]|uniref:GNAT family N-acetyltransferase n=1 Tax=Halosimplex pelagicum TaxID=869886 RepID=A0A7D5TQB9_9EURY|nr:GNAT family N-acetyltransferase [Halosimplex pelagicum]QLH80372.1 GNAT family N-acetyltransferase [Halosimplex pelagicum]